MATSSIFYNFTITDKKSADKFLDALEKADEQNKLKPFESKVNYRMVTDLKEIKTMFSDKVNK